MTLFGKYYFARGAAAPVGHDERTVVVELSEVGDIWQPPTDVLESDRGWLVRLELAGIRPEDVQVRLRADRLTVAGVRRPWCPAKGGSSFRQMEMRHGPFARHFDFPSPVNTEAARAVLHDGVLEITLPRAESVRPPMDWLVLAPIRG